MRNSVESRVTDVTKSEFSFNRILFLSGLRREIFSVDSVDPISKNNALQHRVA